MGFTPEQEGDLLIYLESTAQKVITKLPTREAGEFLNILTDYSVDDDAFELKIAQLFYKIPDKFDELKDSIKDLSLIREAMLSGEGNAHEAREITLEFFTGLIDDLMECAYYEELAEEDELNAAEKKRRHDVKAEKRRMEKEIQKLQDEQQQIFEKEKEDRQQRKEQKKSEQEEVRQIRQAEFEAEIEERKIRRELIEEKIKSIQKELQTQHNVEIEERKKIRLQKQAEIKAKQAKQMEERQKQAKERLNKKEKENMMQQARQQELHSEMEKQAAERRALKEREEKERMKALRAIQEQRNQGGFKPKTPIARSPGDMQEGGAK